MRTVGILFVCCFLFSLASPALQADPYNYGQLPSEEANRFNCDPSGGTTVTDTPTQEADAKNAKTVPLNIKERRGNDFYLVGNENRRNTADTDKAWEIQGVSSWFKNKSDIGLYDDVKDEISKDGITADSSGNSIVLVIGDGTGADGGVDVNDQSRDLQEAFPSSKIARLFGTGQGTTLAAFKNWFEKVNGVYYCILGVNDNEKGAYARCARDVIDAHSDVLKVCLIHDELNEAQAVEGVNLIQPQFIALLPDCLFAKDACFEGKIPMVKIPGLKEEIPFGADVIVIGGGPGCYASSVNDEEEKALYPYFRKVFHVGSHGGTREYTAKALEEFIVNNLRETIEVPLE